MGNEISIHTFTSAKFYELCELFIVYYLQWQVYSHLEPLEVQTITYSLLSVHLCLREEDVLVEAISVESDYAIGQKK